MKRIAISVALACIAAPAAAQIAVSANDNKVVNEAGTVVTVRNAAPDSVSVIDLSVFPPRIVGEVKVPVSQLGRRNRSRWRRMSRSRWSARQ